MLRNIPIPEPTADQQATIETLVTCILEAKKADPAADVPALEREIDQHVYQLYGLDADESALIEEG